MATITTRVQGAAPKGSPLTNVEVDDNFLNLNADKLEKSGGAMTGDLEFGDGKKALFGTGDDLEIYHDGSNSYIDDAGTGQLKIRSSEVLIQKYTDENMARFTSDGAVQLYYDNVNKLATTATGIDVTGTVTADGLTVSDSQAVGVTASISNANSTQTGGSRLDFQYGATVTGRIQNRFNGGDFQTDWYVGNDGLGVFTDVANTEQRLRVLNNGDISFYEDTGTTPKFFWDASAEALSVGDSSAITDRRFQVTGSNASLTGTTNQFGIVNNATFANTVTSNIFNLYTGPNVSSGATLDNLYNLYLEGNNFTGSTVTNSFAVYQAGASDKNYFAGNVGIGTTSPAAGISVVNSNSGTITNTEQVLGTGNVENVRLHGSNSGNNISGLALQAGASGSAAVGLFTEKASTNAANFFIRMDTGAGTSAERMRIDSSGNVGIGTTSPAYQLEIGNGLDASETINIKSTDAGKTSLFFSDASSNGQGRLIYDHAISALQVYVNDSEKMRLDSSGNLLVGTTNADNSDQGIELRNDGRLFATAASNSSAFNRKTDDGDILQFAKEAVTVGSIGVVSGSNFYINNGDTGICFRPSGDDIVPVSSGGSGRDAAIDIGDPSFRFKNLYLSGGVVFGTGSPSPITSNTLDDYEEGTWTATFSAGSWGSISNFTYTKIGRLVHITGFLALPSGLQSSGMLNIGGLPFSGNSNYNMFQLWYNSTITMDATAYLPGGSYTIAVRPVNGNVSELTELSVQMTYITNQ